MLPIEAVFSELVDHLDTHETVLLQAPPGAGKSTWLPLNLMKSGQYQRIVMLEPRRLAARNIAQYLAGQLNESLGQQVGLRIRQEVKVSEQTRLEIVTEGMLTRMIQQDPELSGIDLLIFDEFHERSLAADTALAFALETQAALRDDLKILVMSATLDSERYQSFLQCPLIRSEGRGYPIAHKYIPVKDESQWLMQIAPVIRQALKEESGSILVFLPGQKEIRYVANALQDALDSEPKVHLAMLFGEQDKSAQQAAIAPAPNGERKIVLTTNVAETSLTIEGIRVVIDSGKRRAAVFNLKTGVTELKTVSISRASAVQRAGRAGRIEPGVVYRLGSQALFERRDAHDKPDILSSDISGLILESKVWGTQISDLPLLDMPSLAQCKQAEQLLLNLEAIDNQGKLMTLGKRMQQMGSEPRFAHMLLKVQALETQLSGITLLACYFMALQDSRVKCAPELSLALNQLHHNAPQTFTKQLKYWCKRADITHKTNEIALEHLAIVVALAYPDRLAKRRGNGFVLANGAGVNAHSEFWQDCDYLAIAELGGQQGQTIFSATEFHPTLLEAVLPYLFEQKTVCEFDQKQAQFLHQDRVYLGHWVFSAKPSSAPLNEASRTQAWMSIVKEKGLSVFSAYDDVHQLLVRMQLAAQYFPDVFPASTEIDLVSDLSPWLEPFLGEIKQYNQLKKLDLKSALLARIDWQKQQQLNSLLPERIQVPSGSQIRIQYQLEGPARLAVKMQEVYGMLQSPTLCEGRVDILMELLSPAQRPLQLTQDLAHFWQSSYKDVQKEMKGRYPKHYWPDDPATAIATNKVKSRM
ncbi:ATP-dependent helicase HrpB [Pseudoalteromonas luteoviolacea]|uniref:ATP-dependent helicase HrpB n=1 Tax=Pseudoalteromonas luteoviolacea TaxID=43657 RepID=UPI00061D2FAD|nr:ATP-dependent helicase HrpB [Pseudoalteromonas luteoviolacea]AOT10287.1 ATP-dependent helicase [Pseudoalteromonas luteoviolacea]AOT15202.1 ATP-dependent helicase [Pseudoalteromonas luteoviolacea]AOT20116.1 ATP-dependent helicase [Pseudoalteromonas luteoviolacea]